MSIGRAWEKVAAWPDDYNAVRSNSLLGYNTSPAFAVELEKQRTASLRMAESGRYAAQCFTRATAQQSMLDSNPNWIWGSRHGLQPTTDIRSKWIN